MNQLRPEIQSCIEACQKCLADCQYCLAQMAGQESGNDCPLCCVECINSCEACIKALLVESKWAGRYCEICAEICEWCAEQCGAHTHEHCQKCAASNRVCAGACRKIAA